MSGFPGVAAGANAAPPPPERFPVVGPSAARPPAAPEQVSLKPPELLHIPCPQCKELLETPVEMLDQEVLCPHCHAQFQLLRRHSLEFQRQRAQQLELRERKAGNAWFHWAVVTVVLVLIFLLFLITQSLSG